MTTMTTLTAATVSRILGKRHPRSTSAGTMVRGYRSQTRGFTAEGRGTVTVRHETGSGVYRTSDREATLAALEAYATTLRAAGLRAYVFAPNGERADHRVLRVERP